MFTDRYAKLIGYDPIDPRDFDPAMRELEVFFRKQGLINTPVQHRFGILPACENPHSIAQFTYGGFVFPMRQTGQMDLEKELLTRLRYSSGCYCISHSYREESDPIPGRHDLSFPMFEFELRGDMEVLFEKEKELLEHLGFGSQDSYAVVSYAQMAERYGVAELTAEHEQRMWKDLGPVVFLTHFPESTSPFWNMKRDENGLAKKIDVLLYGIETIGSAERSTDTVDMRNRFLSISNGEYARRLFANFGRGRVLEELDEFLSLVFFPRCGGGIGMTRMIRALKLAKRLF